jgi:ketosteroid isomerase-like protein
MLMSQVIDGTGLTADDVIAIRALVEPWTTACVKRDWDSLLDMCTDDVVFQPPNEPIVEGAAARSWLDRFPTIKAMAWDIEHVEGAGQLAWARGWVRMTLEVSGQQVGFDGKYTDLFRKGSDGTWRFALVVWNSNTAA